MDWFPLNAWFIEDWDLFRPMNIYQEFLPVSSYWTNCFNSLWTAPSLHSWPKTTACPKLSRDLHVTCYSMCFLNPNSSGIPESTKFLIIQVCLSFPPFFRLTIDIKLSGFQEVYISFEKLQFRTKFLSKKVHVC